MPAPRLNWYHLADSAFPTGGYAFSSGLESAAKLGIFTCVESFQSYLGASLRQFVAYEIPFLNSCYRHPDAADVIERYHAGMLAPTMCKASLLQGRSFLRCLDHLLGGDALAETRARFPDDPDRRHFLLAYGWGLREAGMELDEARRCLLYVTLRDWISAAVRLGSIGPMEGHVLQHRLLRQGGEWLEAAAGHGMEQARRSSPALDIAQAYHTRIYSKLFQN